MTRRLWDISPAVQAASPVFPGDTAYSQQWCATIGPGCPVNVSAITLSPHVGAYADAPLHYDAAGASIGNVDLDAFLGGYGEEEQRLLRNDGAGHFTSEYLADTAREVTQAAYKVIAGKGATNYAIGLSGARIVEALLRSENAVLPVSTVLDGQYGISGVALSLPSIVGNGGVRTVLDTPMDDGELASLQHSAETLRQSLATLGI